MTRLLDPFEEIERWIGNGARPRGGAQMPMDAYEKDGAYTLRFDLAGAGADDVDLTIEQGMLTVTAERQLELDTEDGVNWLIRERPTGTHSRQVRLGDRLDTGNVQAHYDAGVLTVTIPIWPESQPQKVRIASTAPPQAINA
ncbi:Hsp20/alpha crystallin family protein [soil metagenome]